MQLHEHVGRGARALDAGSDQVQAVTQHERYGPSGDELHGGVDVRLVGADPVVAHKDRDLGTLGENVTTLLDLKTRKSITVVYLQ